MPARLGLTVAALALLTGCQLTIRVGIDAHADGSGDVRATVTLDRAAADRLRSAGGRLEAADLRRAGWEVTGPTRTDNGGAVLTAVKRFARPQDLPALIREVAGPREPLRDFRLRHDQSFARTRLDFAGTVDLTAGVESFGDDALKQQLGESAGLSAAELERQAGTLLNRFFKIQVAVRLPGGVDSNAPTEAGNGAVWQPELGERAVLSAESAAWNLRRVGSAAVAVLAAGLLLTLVVRSRRRRS